jgi:hypothetical protein
MSVSRQIKNMTIAFLAWRALRLERSGRFKFLLVGLRAESALDYCFKSFIEFGIGYSG